MSTRRPTGAVTPDGSDPISGLVTDLRNLGLTSNRIPTAASQSAAQAIADALASTPYPATTDNGLYVWRSDLRVLTRFDGAAWTDVTPRDSGWVDVTEKAGSSTNLKVKTVGGDLYLSGDIYGTNNQPIPNGGGVTRACVLPATHRPTGVRYLVVSSWVSGGTPAYGRTLTMTVDTAGVVSVYNMSGNASSCASCDLSFAR